MFIIKNTKDVAMNNKLKLLRTMHDLTQEELAYKLEVSRQTINAIESNKYLPSLGLAFKISNLFKVKIEEVFIDENNDSQ